MTMSDLPASASLADCVIRINNIDSFIKDSSERLRRSLDRLHLLHVGQARNRQTNFNTVAKLNKEVQKLMRAEAKLNKEKSAMFNRL